MAWKYWGIGLLLSSVGVSAQDSSTVFSQASNDSLLWGPYRPNLYFGIRPRLPKSVSTGLLWGRVEDFNSVQNTIRFTCEQNEGMAGYGWDAYDPRIGGIQTIHDKENGIDLKTSFVKFNEGRGGWGARIKGVPRKDAASISGNIKTSVWFTVGIEGLGSVVPENAETAQESGYADDVVFDGQTSDLGDFKLRITEPTSNLHPAHKHPSYITKPLDRTLVHSLQVPDEALWQAKPILFGSLKTTLDDYVKEFTREKMPPPWQTYTIQNRPGPGNMHMVQKIFEGPFEFDVLFTPSDSTTNSKDLAQTIQKAAKTFEEKYSKIHRPLAPFNKDKYLEFSQSLFSNLIGGIGYFHGDQVVDRSYAPEYEEENEGFWQDAEQARARNQLKMEGPYELFTSIPSRPFFPRGFLWDEGFHLLPILDWDPELTMQIVSSWFNTMDEDGWIAREQILGSEARSKVPAEFQAQYPHYANPPTLFMVLQDLLDRAGDTNSPFFQSQQTDDTSVNNALTNPEAVKTWLSGLYPLLQRNFEWYRKTQWGDIKSYERQAFSSKEGYRWRGRTPRHILTSGLDDYPRAQPPHPGELHTDLISWMGLMADTMHQVASYVGEADDAETYARIANAIRRNIDDLHWSSKDKTYCDATIDDYEESVHVCHKGYISIFPFMTGGIGPDHPNLQDILDLISDEQELWSPHGVRSLSKQDKFYGTDENYWRSPVWMNMNYLVVKQLLRTAQNPGPQQSRARSLYTALRRNLVDTVYDSWKKTGFAWEQYNPETGEGQRTRHFTGWTSLVVKIMSMPDLSGDGGIKKDKHRSGEPHGEL